MKTDSPLPDNPRFTTPYPYEGRLDVCPWCHVRPSIFASPLERWRVECVNPKCPVQPMSFSFDAVEKSVVSWNYLIKSRR